MLIVKLMRKMIEDAAPYAEEMTCINTAIQVLADAESTQTNDFNW